MNLKKISNKAFEYFLTHKSKIDLGMRTINLVQYALKKQYVEAVKSSIDVVGQFGNEYYYADDFLTPHKGWNKLFKDSEAHIIDLIDLSKYPSRNIKMRGNSVVTMYVLPNEMEIATRSDMWSGWDRRKCIYFNAHISDRQKIVDYLITELFNSLDSQCMVLHDDNIDKHKSIVSIKPYVLEQMPSQISKQLEQYLSNSIQLKMPRSVMLYSEPGTGKSCIAANALINLGLKTLKIDNFNKVSTDFIQLLIKTFKIEAILIDDLDHMGVNQNSMILDFLEKIRKHVRVIIATVNSTKAFHKALLRPGRFDKIIHVHSLDEDVVKGVLGEELVQYFDRVKDWPIAFINELALSSRVEKNVTIEQMIVDLQKRVGDNSADTIDLTKKEETKTTEPLKATG